MRDSRVMAPTTLVFLKILPLLKDSPAFLAARTIPKRVNAKLWGRPRILTNKEGLARGRTRTKASGASSKRPTTKNRAQTSERQSVGSAEGGLERGRSRAGGARPRPRGTGLTADPRQDPLRSSRRLRCAGLSGLWS